jgi:small subunit ribosomal protein S20
VTGGASSAISTTGTTDSVRSIVEFAGLTRCCRWRRPPALGRGGCAVSLTALFGHGFGRHFEAEGFTVANIKSQKKRILTDAKRADRNKAVRSELKTRAKNAVRDAGTETGDEAMRLAVKRLDMAAAKKVIHKNQAARRKSRLMKKINAVTAAAQTTD